MSCFYLSRRDCHTYYRRRVRSRYYARTLKTVRVKMQDAEANNRDHNYSEVKNHLRNNARSMFEDGASRAPNNKQNRPSLSNREPFGQVKDISELKKITPRVKLLAPDASTLNELTKLSSHSQLSVEHKLSILEQAKQELKKYCRTCAGSKLPLVDIFGEKGVQMRLSQQIKHLEDINPYDSLSTQMCMDCICDLKMSYKFFMQIKKAEVKLKSIHGTLTDAAARKEVIRLRTLSASNEAEEKSRKTDTDDAVRAASTSNERKEIKEEEKKIDKPIEQKPEPEMFVLSVKEEPVQEKESIDSELIVKSEPEMFEEMAVHQQSDDNESIEEFDPDDPPNQPDSSEDEDEESDDGLDNSRIESLDGADTMDNETTDSIYVCNENSVHNDTIVDSNQTVYKYDTALKAYIKVEGTEDTNCVSGHPPAAKSKTVGNVEGTKESKQPNILKRRAPPQARKSTVSETDDSGQPDRNGGFKVQKLDVHNPLNINNSQEDGIMYVTVKGSKPNEILLVKVKKMEKPFEKKDDKSSGKKGGTDGKDLFMERSRRSDTREQIIEEQIEEYKRKREKVLGGQTNASLKLESAQPRNFRRSETQETPNRQTYVPQNVPTRVDTDKEDNDTNTTVHTDNEISEESSSTTTKERPSEKAGPNTEEYLARLAKLKLKWEEAKKRKESLQKQLDESYTDGNIEKLKRILGEKEKNLQEFQDYLKQRQIVITRLKDEDIISLYEDRNNAVVKSNFPDLIDEAQPIDYVPEQRYLECDYCIETFASKEVLEEHLKTHDYKIMHYCEDCMEEFPTNKAKRNHNMVCIKKLLCKYCDLMLDSKGKKRQHEQKHCDSMFGQLCDVCGEKFKHQGTLDQHVKTQHMSWEKIYQCPKCPKKFAFKQKLSFHLKSVHTTLRAYLCEDCGADFKNPASLRHHRIRKHQPVGNKRECPVCHKLVPFYSLSKHMHTHKAYTIQCPHCDKMFKNSSTLKQHVRIHEDQRQYRCDTCGVGFNRRDGLRLHMRVHEKTDSRGLKECSCQVCGEKFPNHSTLVIHRNRVHKDGRQYTCHICNRSMISTRSLEWHMSHIHNESLPGIVKHETDGTPEKKRVSCYHCNKTFKTEMILRTHIKNTHMEKDPMKCLDCEMTFTSEVRLRHHMMVTHNRLEGTLACPHCPKRFVNQLRLKTHMISHSEERPYTCEICGFNLKTKIQLIKHHQNRHSDERPLQCKYCPWRCKQVSALVCHERTHTNERPYSCSVCRQRFKYLGDKNKHERRHESLGGSGFKRIVHGRNVKAKIQEDSSSDPEQEALANVEQQLTEGQYDEQSGEQYPGEPIVKFEEQEITEEYEQVYEQEYEETSREASDAAEVIMNMEDTTVYTEEVTADNIESAEIMADEMMTNEILQSGTVVHLQQEDDSGKIQVIPVMLSLPDLSDTNAEVNLATASIMYNN